jgi:hypothetical protein
MPDHRTNDQIIIDKIDGLVSTLNDVKVDTAVIREKVRCLEEFDAGNRLTKIETRNKFIAIVGGILLSLSVVKEQIIDLLFG